MKQLTSVVKVAAVHYGNVFEYLSLWSEVQFLEIQKSKKNLRNPNFNLDFTPETCEKIENMLILNSRYRGIVVVEMLILLSRYRGIVAIQGNYPQKCCHSALV